MKTSAGGDVGEVQSKTREKIDASSNTDTEKNVEDHFALRRPKMNDAFCNTENDLSSEDNEGIISASVVNMVDASTAVDETSRSHSGTNTDETWCIANPYLDKVTNENIDNGSCEQKRIMRSTKSNLPPSYNEAGVAIKNELQQGAVPVHTELKAIPTEFNENTEQYTDTIPPPPPYENYVSQGSEYGVTKLENAGTDNAAPYYPTADHDVDIPPPPPLLSEDDVDDVRSPILRVDDDNTNIALSANEDTGSSEYKNRG